MSQINNDTTYADYKAINQELVQSIEYLLDDMRLKSLPTHAVERVNRAIAKAKGTTINWNDTPDIKCPCPKCGHSFAYYHTPLLKSAPDLLAALEAREAYIIRYGYRSASEMELHKIELAAIAKAKAGE